MLPSARCKYQIWPLHIELPKYCDTSYTLPLCLLSFLEVIINFSRWILVLYSHDREQKYLMYESESQET